MPLPLLPLIVGGINAGVFNSLLGSWSQESADMRNFELQKKLMLYQSELQKKNQIELLRSQYPELIAGYKNAGLNPAAGGDVAGMSSPMPSASKSASPFPMVDIGSQMSNFANAELAAQQGKYYEQLASKTEQESVGQSIQNSILSKQNEVFFDDWKSQMINRMSESMLNKSNTSLNRYRIKEVLQNIDYIKAGEKKLLSDVALNQETMLKTRAERSSWNSYISSVIKQNLSIAGLNFGRESREVQSFLYDLLNTDAITSYYNSQAALSNMNKKMLDLTFELENRYGDADRITRIINNVLGSVGSFVGGAAGAFFGSRNKFGFPMSMTKTKTQYSFGQ